MPEYDLIIIGGGPAALSAGIYAARKKIKALLLTLDFAGQTSRAYNVENYLGFPSIRGSQLLKKFLEHLKMYQLEIKEGVRIVKIQKKKIGQERSFLIFDDVGSSYQARAIIIATGKQPRKLNVPGEEKLIGKGVSFCAICDAPLFKRKDVAVIGGGNSALTAALDLTKYAHKIYLLCLENKFSADEIIAEKIKLEPKITVIYKAKTEEIKGKERVEKLIYKDLEEGKKKEIFCQGIFVEIGLIPNSGFVSDLLKLNQAGEIMIDKKNRTSQEGIFAAGDVTNVSEKQIIIAAGEGAKAALSAYKYLVSTTARNF